LLEEGRARLAEHALLKGLGNDMATTFTLVYLMADRVFVAWCGDSRVYHLRGNEILFRTTDHSLVHSLVKNGELSEEDARAHPQKNLLLKAIRADEPGPEAEGHWIRDVKEGDRFLLCTDGLLENITDADLLALVQVGGNPEKSLASAFQDYCYNRTRDNYSMYLIRVSPGGVEEDASTPAERRQSRASWLLLLLVILIVAAAFVIRENYRTPRKVAPATTKVVAAPSAVAPKKEIKIQTVIPIAASAKDTITP
jgi:serine/threonine protein phosphatase PrpC